MFCVDTTLARGYHAVGIKFSHDVVSVTLAATGAALTDTALEAAVCLQGEVLEVERVHRALESHVELRDLAFRYCDQLDVAEGELLVETGHVLLVPREAIEGLGDDDLKLTRSGILQELLIAGAKGTRTAHGRIRVGCAKGPALFFDMGAAEPDLILDGGLALVVGGVAGVDRGACHEVASATELLFCRPFTTSCSRLAAARLLA